MGRRRKEGLFQIPYCRKGWGGETESVRACVTSLFASALRMRLAPFQHLHSLAVPGKPGTDNEPAFSCILLLVRQCNYCCVCFPSSSSSHYWSNGSTQSNNNDDEAAVILLYYTRSIAMSSGNVFLLLLLWLFYLSIIYVIYFFFFSL